METQPRMRMASISGRPDLGPILNRAGRCIPLALVAVMATTPVIAQNEQPEPPQAPELDSPSLAEDGSRIAFTYTPYQEWADGEAPTSTPEELDDIYRAKTPTFDLPFIDGPIDRFIAATASLEESTGLRLGFAYTTIFQQASGGEGRRRGASGDLDIMGAWTLIGRGTPNTGQLIFSFEERHKFGPEPASNLRPVLGTLHPPTNGFNDRGAVVRDVYWIQRLLDGKLGFALGRGDTSDFFGAHRMQSLNNSFSNRSMAANTVIPSPGHGLFAGFSVRPVDEFYATVGTANAYGSTTINDMSYLDEGSFFSFGEFGYTPDIEGLGAGAYRVVLWHIDAREERAVSPSDHGFSIIADQRLGERFQVFARYGYADDGRVTGIRQSGEIGMGIRGLLGSEENMTGLGFAYSEARASGAQDEKILECFHRWQLTRHTQFSIGVQGIFDPSNDTDTDSVAVFTTRFRIAF